MFSPPHNDGSTFGSPPGRPPHSSDLVSPNRGRDLDRAVIHIEGFEIIRRIGGGGQGDVYLGRDRTTKRSVAIKVLRTSGPQGDTARKRFKREIELVAQLKHANIVTLFQAGETSDGRTYYAMDYVAGRPLHEYVRDHHLTVEQLLKMMATVCDAVAYGHSHSVIHRDLKPSNIVVDGDGTPHVLDFGLAKKMLSAEETLVSLPGDMLGTIRYMAPEQAASHGEEVNAATDVYALGLILYEMLTSEMPYPMEGSLSQILRNIVECYPDPPSAKWKAGSGISGDDSENDGGCPVDYDLDTIVLTALAKEKERRYASAAELADDIRRYLAGQSIQARRESATYRAGMQVRSFMRRHKVTTFLATALVAWLLALWIGVPLIYRWTPANIYFEKAAFGLLNIGAFNSIDNVRVVALRETTDVLAIAEREGVDGVDPSDKKSLRRLNGRLMEKLVDSGCRVVLWDFTFKGNTPHDEHFARGAHALQQAGIDVVIGVDQWHTDESGMPEMSDGIAASGVRWGALTVRFVKTVCAQLFVRRGNRAVQPSFALEALAAYRAPGMHVDYVIDKGHEELLLRYWRPDPAIPRARQYLSESDIVRPSRVCRGTEEIGEFEKAFGADLGLSPEDTAGFFLIKVPPEDALARITTDYEEVMAADEETLQEKFSNKAVMICPLVKGHDTWPLDSGREVFGCYGQVPVVEALIRNASVRLPLLNQRRYIPLAGALVGALIVVAPAKRGRRRKSVAVGFGLFCAISALIVWQYELLLNPLLALVGILSALLVAAGAQRVLIKSITGYRRHP